MFLKGLNKTFLAFNNGGGLHGKVALTDTDALSIDTLLRQLTLIFTQSSVSDAAPA